jgi:HPt (histidine-containing phosphotransfer) domain-containing protein
MGKKSLSTSETVWNLPELLHRVDNDQELLRDLLTIFKEDFPKTIQRLEAAVAAADLKNAAALSHTLKGMLSNLGGTRAAAAASALEQLANAGEKVALRQGFDALQQESARLLPELDAYMAEVRH